MNVRVVSIVIGSEYEQMADLTLPRAEKLLGRPIERVGAEAGTDAFDLKLQLMSGVEDDTPVLYLDTDLVFRSWDWSPFDPDRFNAVLDYVLDSWAGGHLRKELGLEAKECINSGLWMVTRKFLPVFERAFEVKKELERCQYFLRLGEQTALNMALQELGVEINYIPNDYNHQVGPGKDPRAVPDSARVVHLVGNSVGPKEKYIPGVKLKRVKEALDAHPLD